MTRRQFSVGAAAAVGVGHAPMPCALASRSNRRSAMFESIAAARKALSATLSVNGKSPGFHPSSPTYPTVFHALLERGRPAVRENMT